MFQDVRVIAAQYYMYLLVAATYHEFTCAYKNML